MISPRAHAPRSPSSVAFSGRLAFSLAVPAFFGGSLLALFQPVAPRCRDPGHCDPALPPRLDSLDSVLFACVFADNRRCPRSSPGAHPSREVSSSPSAAPVVLGRLPPDPAIYPSDVSPADNPAWFPTASLNYAANLLRHRTSNVALIDASQLHRSCASPHLTPQQLNQFQIAPRLLLVLSPTLNSTISSPISARRRRGPASPSPPRPRTRSRMPTR